MFCPNCGIEIKNPEAFARTVERDYHRIFQ